MLTGEKLYIAILLIVAVTFLTRAFPFILFGKNNTNPPDIVLYLGKYLPPAIITCILVYCFKDVSFIQAPFGIREIISVLVVALLHTYKGNAMLSILSGTFIYMVFTQFLY